MNKPSLEERQQEQKLLLIDQLKKVPIVQVACEKLSVSRASFYRWKKQDAAFAKEVDEATAAGELLVNDMAESQLVSAIKDKNLTAIIFWLKHHHPRYATRVEVTAQLKRAPEELTPEQEAVVMKALELAALVPATQISDDGVLQHNPQTEEKEAI